MIFDDRYKIILSACQDLRRRREQLVAPVIAGQILGAVDMDVPSDRLLSHIVAEALLRRGPGAAAMLSGTVGRVVGRGPGLTPAGDDVLVGILTVLGSTAARPMGASLRARLVAALRPWLGTTGDISRQLLQQVMQGSPGRALHELGQAVVEGMDEAAMQSALERLLDSGGSSGADGCIGLIAACRRLWLPAERAIA